MNYAWEAALLADREKIPREKLQFVPVDDGSPYTEVVREILNANTLNDTIVEINPLYRFAGVFADIFDQNTEGYEQTSKVLFRVFMQYMVQLDLRQGLSRQEYAAGFLLRDILHGVCGSDAARAIECFEKEKQRQLLRLILKLYQCGSSISLFKEVMRCLYPGSLVYASNDKVRQLLIYIGVKETEEERMKMEFLQGMFLSVDYQVFLFWEHHFGIIDVEETLELDHMVLF